MDILSRALAAAMVVLGAIGLTACAGDPLAPTTASQPTDSVEAVMSTEHWVVVTFGGQEAWMSGDLLDQLLPTEMAADEALTESGVGYIDGNDIGANEYQLYFVGEDRQELWAVLEPIFAAAPVQWTKVSLMASLDDPDPIILTPDS